MPGIGYQFWMDVDGTEYPYLSQGIEENHMMNVDDQSHTGHASPLVASEGVKVYAGPISANMSYRWASLFRSWVVTARDTQKDLVIDTDDHAAALTQYHYSNAKAVSGDISSTAGEGNLISCSVNIAANNYDNDGSTYERGEVISTAISTDPAHNENSPMPFYCSTIVATGNYTWDADQVLAWNLSINNGTIVQYAHGGARVARYIQAGPLSVTGSVTLYDDETHIAKPAVGDRSVITLNLAGSLTDNGEFGALVPSLYLRNVGFLDYPDAAAGRGEKKTRVVNFFGLGDGTNECICYP